MKLGNLINFFEIKNHIQVKILPKKICRKSFFEESHAILQNGKNFSKSENDQDKMLRCGGPKKSQTIFSSHFSYSFRILTPD